MAKAGDRKLIAARIKERMAVVGLTQEKLAAAVGVKQATVSRWVLGKDAPNGVRMTALAAALQTTTDYLTGAAATSPGLPSERRQLITEVAAGMLSLFERVAQGESPQVLDLPHGDSIPLPKLTMGEWERQLQLIRPVFDELAGGDWASLSPADRRVLVERLVDYYLSNGDHTPPEASA